MFLLIPAGVILLALVVVALRSRTPRTIDSGIRDHQRHMGALSTEARRALSATKRRVAPPAAGARPQRRTAGE
jgi:hypothetical protein